MLLTRSPLYSSPERDFLVRLACIRHAASVRSEPGSNSPQQFQLLFASQSICPNVTFRGMVCSDSRMLGSGSGGGHRNQAATVVAFPLLNFPMTIELSKNRCEKNLPDLRPADTDNNSSPMPSQDFFSPFFAGDPPAKPHKIYGDRFRQASPKLRPPRNPRPLLSIGGAILIIHPPPVKTFSGPKPPPRRTRYSLVAQRTPPHRRRGHHTMTTPPAHRNTPSPVWA